MSTSSHAGHQPLNELPLLSDYSPEELKNAESWPAIRLYRHLITQIPRGFGDELRVKRHTFWLRCALATFYEKAPAEAICRFWSDSADKIIKSAWQAAGFSLDDYALIALGKLGARELNLSSDVDLVVVRADHIQADPQALHTFQKIVSDATSFGYALRVDLGLRPGGKSSSALPSLSEFIHYYGYQGEMWERLAYVRMRFLHAPEEIEEEISAFMRKFSYRKHLDYTLLEELKGLRSKIRKEHFSPKPNVFHLKLGQGGIRELELFTHALQVLHGGRNSLLQTNSTSKALDSLAALALLPQNECSFLKEAYWYLRDLENRIHAYDDQQTYNVDLLKGHEALPVNFEKTLLPKTERVCSIADSFFGPEEDKPALPSSQDQQETWLKELGYSKESISETWPNLLSSTALSRRSTADEQARLNFLYNIVVKLAETGLDKDLGLSLLLDFVRSVRAKASFFTLLNREPRVRDELAMLFSISPYLGTILASRPELIDEFIFRKKAEPSDDFDALLDDLADRRLLAELISASRFLADRNLKTMTLNLSENADQICTTLLQRLNDDLDTQNLALMALGKWGGRELGLRSDLDFIFITKAAPTHQDQKVAKRFLSRITEPHRGGAIYPVDMRLRPSGHAGPILVSEDQLYDYLRNNAAAWERQAYLRARPLAENTCAEAGPIAAKRGLTQEDINELKSIRTQLFSNASAFNSIDLKLNIGGLADIEFTAQIALLMRREFSLDRSTDGMIQYLESIEPAWSETGPELRKGYEYLRCVEQLFQLTTRESGSKLKTTSQEFARLARIMNLSAASLEKRLRDELIKIADLLQAARDLVH